MSAEKSEPSEAGSFPQTSVIIYVFLGLGESTYSMGNSRGERVRNLMIQAALPYILLYFHSAKRIV